jgi:hypothetical protein
LSVTFQHNDSILQKDTVMYFASNAYYISRYNVGIKNEVEKNCIAVCARINDTVRRFICVQENDHFALKLIESIINDSLIKVEMLAMNTKFLLNFDNNKFMEDCTTILKREKRNYFMGCFFEIRFRYVSNNLRYKRIGYYPWRIEPADYTQIKSECNIMYLDIRRFDSEFLNNLYLDTRLLHP